jgi:flagellar biosynthesis GTPase FlhF
VNTFTEDVVLRSFHVTGIAPLNPSIVVNKFIHEDSEDSSNTGSSTSVYSGKDWLKIESLVRNISTDRSSKDTRKILRSLHHISIQNELLHNEIVGLKNSLQRKKKHSKKSHTLPLQQRQEYHGGAVLWSPSKRREAEHRYDVVQRLDMEGKLRKADERKLAAAKKLSKEKEKEQRRVARKAAKEVREKEKADAAIQKAVQMAEKQRQKEERNASKALQLSQKSKRRASQAPGPKSVKNASILMMLLVLLLRRCPHRLHTKQQSAAATSSFQQNSNSTSFSQAINYYYTTKSHTNSCCGWLNSLILFGVGGEDSAHLVFPRI